MTASSGGDRHCVVYTVGIAFYAMSKRVAYSHGIWHLLVIAGSLLHYLVVARFVA